MPDVRIRSQKLARTVAGLSAAALFLTAAIFAPSDRPGLVFLSLAYGEILFQQPSLCALCLDVGRKDAGAVFGFMKHCGPTRRHHSPLKPTILETSPVVFA